MAEVRVTQATVEVLWREQPVVRVTQAAVEVLRANTAEGPEEGGVTQPILFVLC